MQKISLANLFHADSKESVKIAYSFLQAVETYAGHSFEYAGQDGFSERSVMRPPCWKSCMQLTHHPPSTSGPPLHSARTPLTALPAVCPGPSCGPGLAWPAPPFRYCQWEGLSFEDADKRVS